MKKEQDNPIVIGVFDVPITIELSNSQILKALKLLNLHYLGDEECNVYDSSNKLVAKYPELEKTTGIKDAHYSCRRSFIQKVQVKLYSNGKLEMI